MKKCNENKFCLKLHLADENQYAFFTKRIRMIEVCALASGSNGNCYYVGNENEAVLVDVGISARQITLRIEQVGIPLHKIKAIFVSHEHADHIRGVRVFSKRFNLPVYITRKTYVGTTKKYLPQYSRFFEPGETINIGDLKVHSFAKWHDAAEPCSFRIENGSKSVGVMTDIGQPCQNVIQHIKQSNILFLESNYDEDSLWKGAYPWPLKKRIASDHGHLSNKQALDLITEHAEEPLHTIFLSHLSGENNNIELAMNNFSELFERFEVKPTFRHEPTEVFKF